MCFPAKTGFTLPGPWAPFWITFSVLHLVLTHGDIWGFRVTPNISDDQDGRGPGVYATGGLVHSNVHQFSECRDVTLQWSWLLNRVRELLGPAIGPAALLGLSNDRILNLDFPNCTAAPTGSF